MLLARWREGDATAGNELFQRHFRSIRRFMGNKVRDEDAQELVQNTFAACVAHREAFRGDSRFRTYLFAIARNQLLMYLRKRGRAGEAADFNVSSVQDLGTSPSSAVGRTERRDLVRAALRTLPVSEQMMLELYYWEDVSPTELAKILEISPVTARTRLFRSRQKLRERLAEAKFGEDDLEVSVRGAG